jgi:hypothetical protein
MVRYYTPLFLVDKLKTYVNSTEETRIDLATGLSYEFVDGLTGRVRTSGQLLQNRFHQERTQVHGMLCCFKTWTRVWWF